MDYKNKIKIRKIGINNEFVWCIAGIIFTVFYCFIAFNLWNFDISIPYVYGESDVAFELWIAKRFKDGFFINSHNAAPFESVFIDFPLYGDTLMNLWVDFLMTITESLVTSVNLFYFSLFPLTFCISFFVMRRMGISAPLSFCGSVLYSFLPYRFMRNFYHLYLSNYSFVPLTFYLCYFIYIEPKHFSDNKKKWPLYLGALVVIALNGIYYAFFSCFFILLTVIITYWRDHKIPYSGLMALLIIVLIIGISMIPNAIMLNKYGATSVPTQRVPLEAELYGSKLTHYFLPLKFNTIPFIKEIKENYSGEQLALERSEYSGLIGSIGISISLITIFLSGHKNKLLELLSKLNLGGILLSTIGGFGSLFALIISPQIRCYNRISVFVAFISILSFFVVIELLSKRLKSKKIIMFAVILFSIFSLWEQTIFFDSSQSPSAFNYLSDEAFVKEIENYASDGAMIFQLPYQPFPENPPINDMADYALLKGYLYSDTLRWSSGAYRGRSEDLWRRQLSEMDINDQIAYVADLGFEGIYIDTYGYKEEELEQLCEDIETLIGEGVKFRSLNERLLFYGLNENQNSISEMYSKKDIEELHSKLDIGVSYRNGFSFLESNDNENWRWCDKTGEIKLYNFFQQDAVLHFSSCIATESSETSTLTIKVGDDTLYFPVNNEGSQVDFEIPISTAETIIYFETDAPKVDAPEDSRSMFFRLFDATIQIS